MKSNKLNRVKSTASLINKYYESKDVVGIVKLFRKLNLDLIIKGLNELDNVPSVLFFLMAIPKKKASAIYRYLPNELQDNIVEIASNNQIKIIFHELYPDEILDIANRNKDNFKKILINLSVEQRNLIKKIDGFKDDQVGSFMNPDFISFNDQWSIEKCLKEFKKHFNDIEDNLIIFVTNSKNILLGQVRLQDLFFANDYSDKVSSIMSESIISVNSNDDIETVINLFQDYHFDNIGVIDNQNKLVGIINDNDILPAMEVEVTEDIYNMYGIQKTEDSYIKASIFKIMKSRLLWVLILMLSATLTSIAISLFENLGNSLTAGLSSVLLVPIIPVITGTSGNTGSQSFATVVRAIAIGDVTPKEYRKVIRKEFQIGLLLGTLLGVANTLRLCIYFAIPYFRTYGDTEANYVTTLYISIGSSIALFLAVVLAKLFGASLPILATKLKLDPTLMSGPLISTSLDLCSTSLLFGIGITILHFIPMI